MIGVQPVGPILNMIKFVGVETVPKSMSRQNQQIRNLLNLNITHSFDKQAVMGLNVMS